MNEGGKEVKSIDVLKPLKVSQVRKMHSVFSLIYLFISNMVTRSFEELLIANDGSKQKIKKSFLRANAVIHLLSQPFKNSFAL